MSCQFDSLINYVLLHPGCLIESLRTFFFVKNVDNVN